MKHSPGRAARGSAFQFPGVEIELDEPRRENQNDEGDDAYDIEKSGMHDIFLSSRII